MNQKHTIHSLIFEIDDLESNSQYQNIANRISAIVHSSLKSRISRLLDQYSIQGYHIIIDKLEIDLEYINISNLENSILLPLERQLKKMLRNVKIKSEYSIKHKIYNANIQITEQEENFYRILDEKEKNASGNLQISKNPADYFKSMQHTKVVPLDARYFDAIMHFLEYGWLPTFLEIPEDQFLSILNQTISKYQNEINKYFGLKSKKIKDEAQTRIIQLKNRKGVFQTSKINTSSLDKLIKPVLKILEQKSYTESDLSPSDKKMIQDVLKKLKQTNFSSDELNQLKSKVSKLTKGKNKKETDYIFLSTDEKFELKLKKLLDSNDREEFNKLLNEPFIKSLVKSYVPKYDSKDLLSRALIPLLNKPDQRESIFKSLPRHIQSEKEILNQIYQTSPILISEIFSRASKLNRLDKDRYENLFGFLSALNKRHIDFIMKSYLSNYPKITTSLNALNSEIKKKSNFTSISTKIIQKILKDSISYNKIKSISDHSKFTHIHLILLFSVSSENAQTILLKYLDVLEDDFNIQIEKVTKLPKTKIVHKISNKILRKSDSDEKLTISTIERDYSIVKQESKDTALYLLKTLIQEQYIPSINNSVLPPTPKKMIQLLDKHFAKGSKKEIELLFKENNILQNVFFRKLTKSDFQKYLDLALPTSKARMFSKLFDKYHYLWKTLVDAQQIQLIFLSLIKHQSEINDSTIFHYYFQELKKYKAWTFDVHKKRIIDNYELHRDKLNETEREIIINYIDNIPTYQKLEFKDTKKKLAEGIPVKNAGLVLLWPFFKTLFTLSGYIDSNGEFIDKESRERATLILQYLAVKSSAAEEPYLALNKILTGFPLEDSIPTEIILTEKEKDISDALLMNVIKQWPSFQNSSIDNLRGSFIIRDGILYFKGDHWVLRVESKAYDLLLGKLPWGYSMIRLSWLPYMIKVEWN